MVTIVQVAVARVAKDLGMTRKSGSWYLAGPESILVLNLQKSNYSRRYFVNLGAWLLEIEHAEFLPEHKAHIRTRATQLVESPERLDQLLDADWLEQHPDQEAELRETLHGVMDEVIPMLSSLDALRSDDGRAFLRSWLVNGEAQLLLG